MSVLNCDCFGFLLLGGCGDDGDDDDGVQLAFARGELLLRHWFF